MLRAPPKDPAEERFYGADNDTGAPVNSSSSGIVVTRATVGIIRRPACPR